MTNGKRSMLKNSVYKTVAFFDAQGIALTLLEIKNYLSAAVSIGEIERTLKEDLRDQVEYRDGLYFLVGRSDLVSQKKIHFRISLVRFHKAKKYLKFLRHLPFLRAVAISGSQALLNSAPSSDIDLFIITAQNRIWFARSLVSFYFQLLGQRRHGLKISNRFCLNHYLAGDFGINEDRNLYTAVEYVSLIPVLGQDTMDEFWRSNTWISEFIPQARFETKAGFFGFQFSIAQKIFEKLLDYTIAGMLNRVLGLYQKQRIRRQEHILVSDRELSFHPGSRGQRVLASFQKRLNG